MPTPHPTLHSNLLVSEVMDRWPQTIQTFVQLHMACPGCAIARFHTLAEVALEYKMSPADLVRELQQAIDKAHDTSVPDTQDPGTTWGEDNGGKERPI